MELAADRPDELGQPPLDRHVDVDVVGVERERAALELRPRPDRARSAEIHTFTAGSGPDDPEIMRAGFVAGRIGAIQHDVQVTPAEVTEQVPEVVWHLEHPIARTETVQFYALGQKATGLVDTMLTGVAADGLFAGMPRHKILWLIEQLPFLRGPLTEFYDLTQVGRSPETMLGRLLERITFAAARRRYPPSRAADTDQPCRSFRLTARSSSIRVLCAGFQELVASWLPKLERTLRAGGVSFASPFLDRDLMRVAFTIPGAHKIRRGKEKYVLRQAIRSIVPAEVLNVPKFPMKMRHDRVFSDALDTLADRILSRERVERRGFMDLGTVGGCGGADRGDLMTPRAQCAFGRRFLRKSGRTSSSICAVRDRQASRD